MSYNYPGNPYFGDGYSNMTPAQRLQEYDRMNQRNYSQQIPPPPQVQNSAGGIIWVQGLEGAKSYMLPPNSNVLLMDSEGTRFYLKSTDSVGMPSTRVYEFREVTGSPSPQNIPTVSMENFVKREEFETLRAEINQYKELLSILTEPKPVSKNEGGINNV